MSMTDAKIKVSICVVTYNHEKYIHQCLQSIVSQNTNFSFEIIVGDDCSTDGTRLVIQEFLDKYPKIVKLISHDKNIGATANYLHVHDSATGEYIAHLDGDDYMLPMKLQIQADFLDRNSDINIAWHRMYIRNEKTGMMLEDLINLKKFPKDKFDRGDVLRNITIGMHSSKMYRSSLKKFLLPNFPLLDYSINVEQLDSGFASFVSDVPLGVYRAGIGIASAGDGTKILLAKTFLYFLEKYPEHANDIGSAAFLLFLAALKNRKWSTCKVLYPVLKKTLNIKIISGIYFNREIISMLRLPTKIRNDKC